MNVLLLQQPCDVSSRVLQPGMSLPDNIRTLFSAAPGAMPRGSALAGPGFVSGAEANQTHAQAGTRAGGWAEGVGSNATAVSGLAGTTPVWEPCMSYVTYSHVNLTLCSCHWAELLQPW